MTKRLRVRVRRDDDHVAISKGRRIISREMKQFGAPNRDYTLVITTTSRGAWKVRSLGVSFEVARLNEHVGFVACYLTPAWLGQRVSVRFER